MQPDDEQVLLAAAFFPGSTRPKESPPAALTVLDVLVHRLPVKLLKDVKDGHLGGQEFGGLEGVFVCQRERKCPTGADMQALWHGTLRHSGMQLAAGCPPAG